jgi:hypothetical protein
MIVDPAVVGRSFRVEAVDGEWADVVELGRESTSSYLNEAANRCAGVNMASYVIRRMEIT